MCTISFVPHEGALSVLCNRDENHGRPAAFSPTMHRIGGRKSIMPIDPQGGGTWIAVNDAGLVLALLNRRRVQAPDPSVPVPTRSRGLVIPALLGAANVNEAVNAAAGLDPSPYHPFTLVIADIRELATLTSDGTTLALHRQPLVLPVMLTSSSLDDQLAGALRGRLFRRMVLSARRHLDAQREYHGHQWDNCREFSVRMWRPDARTVSRTSVQLNASGFSLDYAALPAA